MRKKQNITEHTHKKSRGRPRVLDRKTAIEAALQLFWRQGYAGTSISDLTRILQTTPPSIYSLFGSKEQLYREVIEAYMHTYGRFIASAFEEESSTYLAVKVFLDKAIELYCSGPWPLGCMIGTSLLSAATDHDHLSTEISNFRLSTSTLLKQKFDTALTNGELDANTNTSALSTFYSIVILGISIQARDGVEESTLKHAAKIALSAWPCH